jgi:two-component system sensor histidine kinase YesM
LFYSVKEAKTTYIVRIFIAVVLTVFLSGLLFREITVQFNYLLKKMSRVRSGNLELYPFPKKNRQDELGRLNQYFDQMTVDFKKVIDDNYVKELLLTQTQLKSLEQQINPHFLYNSLETIHWFANRSGEKHISAIVQALGKLLRSSLSEKQDLIPLEEEMKVLENYLLIQKIRFPDTLSVSLEIAEEALPYLIPKMSIQPLVENAVIYGLEENIDGCHIIVRAEVQDKMLHIEIENNGSEINEDVLLLLREHKIAAKRNGVGLINIDSRIKLLFGSSYGLEFKNEKNHVIVFFNIPARIENNTAPEQTT